MNLTEIREYIKSSDLASLSGLYSEPEAQRGRYLAAIDSYERLYGDADEVYLLSVPGRSEILGNHTDHNGGSVLAGAIDRDIVAVVSKTNDNTVKIKSEGYDEDTVELSLAGNPDNFENYSSASLIAGVADGFTKKGYSVGGYRAYSTSDVLKGSGISSSAAYEVMIGNIFNHLYCGGRVENTEIAKISQYAENVYFGKPSGLMDQMACAVGGFVFMDFSDKASPKIDPVSFSLADYGYELCIVNTGGNHADLNDDYASVPREMRDVAAVFEREILSGLCESDIISHATEIRRTCGDRALLRALHFVRENVRVANGSDALKRGDVMSFFDTVLASGRSSFEYLQNVYTNKNVEEQGLSLALALTDGFEKGAVGAFRVHGGGFAGTIQAYVKSEYADAYSELMSSVFGKGAVMRLTVRNAGAVRVL